ncbi:MAG: 4.1 kDa unknown protein [Tomato albetovirus 1]|nr:MAG: 4.1 kDa unknown protein [Tomato albetovirus 1]
MRSYPIDSPAGPSNLRLSLGYGGTAESCPMINFVWTRP